MRRARSAKVDNVDVDLLVEMDRRAYVVEVENRPRVEDVGALLAKAAVVSTATDPRGRRRGRPLRRSEQHDPLRIRYLYAGFAQRALHEGCERAV